MSSIQITFLVGSLLAVALAATIVWPRTRRRPGAFNNWRQRTGNELHSVSSNAAFTNEAVVAGGGSVDCSSYGDSGACGSGD